MATEPDPAAETTSCMEKGLGECVFRVMVPKQKIESITDFTRKISLQTKANILVVTEHIDPDFIVQICSEEEKGALASPAMDALIKVFKRVNGFPEDESDGVASASNIPSCSIRLAVQSNQVKSLIGSPGPSIEAILERTGCSYRLLWGVELSSTYLCPDDRIITLWGEALKVVHALEVVGTYMRMPPKMRLPSKRKRVEQIRTPSPSPSPSPPSSPSSPWSPATPVPPHPWLQFENPIFQERYDNLHNACWIHQRPLVDSVLQEFGVLDSVEKYLTYVPWRRLFHIDDPEYRVLTLEFLSTFELHKIPSTDPGYITFHLGGVPRSFSLIDWAVITDMYTVEESRSQAFQLAISKWPARWNANAFWDEHGIGSYNNTFERKTCQLKDPGFRILQKALSHSLCARLAIHDNIVSSTEMFYLSCMTKLHDCNLAVFLARLFSRYSFSNSRCVIGARFITRIARMLQIDLSDLEEEPQSETWDKQRLEEVGILVPGDHGGLVLAPPAGGCIPSTSTTQQHGRELASKILEGVRAEQTAIRSDQTQMKTTLAGLVDDISEIGRVVGLLAARRQIPTRLHIKSSRGESVSSGTHYRGPYPGYRHFADRI